MRSTASLLGASGGERRVGTAESPFTCKATSGSRLSVKVGQSRIRCASASQRTICPRWSPRLAASAEPVDGSPSDDATVDEALRLPPDTIRTPVHWTPCTGIGGRASNGHSRSRPRRSPGTPVTATTRPRTRRVRPDYPNTELTRYTSLLPRNDDPRVSSILLRYTRVYLEERSEMPPALAQPSRVSLSTRRHPERSSGQRPTPVRPLDLACGRHRAPHPSGTSLDCPLATPQRCALQKACSAAVPWP